MSLSPTVLKFAAAAFVVGTIAFVAAGLAHRPAGTSVGAVVVNTLLFATPAVTVLGAAVGFIWEKIFGPLGGRPPEPPGEAPAEPVAAESQASSRASRPSRSAKPRRRRKAKR